MLTVTLGKSSTNIIGQNGILSICRATLLLLNIVPISGFSTCTDIVTIIYIVRLIMKTISSYYYRMEHATNDTEK